MIPRSGVEGKGFQSAEGRKGRDIIIERILGPEDQALRMTALPPVPVEDPICGESKAKIQERSLAGFPAYLSGNESEKARWMKGESMHTTEVLHARTRQENTGGLRRLWGVRIDVTCTLTIMFIFRVSWKLYIGGSI